MAFTMPGSTIESRKEVTHEPIHWGDPTFPLQLRSGRVGSLRWCVTLVIIRSRLIKRSSPAKVQHTKLLICYLLLLVTIVMEEREGRNFEEFGPIPDLSALPSNLHHRHHRGVVVETLANPGTVVESYGPCLINAHRLLAASDIRFLAAVLSLRRLRASVGIAVVTRGWLPSRSLRSSAIRAFSRPL
jgi:hypothetical protein